MSSTHRRLTAGPPADNLPAIIDAIERDALQALHRAEMCAGELEVGTALALLLRPALDELASYWPEPGIGTETLRQAQEDLALIKAAYNADITRWRERQDSEESMAVEISRLRDYIAELEVARRPPAAIDWPDEDEPAGVTVAALEPEEVTTAPRNFPVVNWTWNGSIWLRVPSGIRNIIMELETRKQTWRHVDKDTRYDIARHVLSFLGPDTTQDAYNVMRPAWMPAGVTLSVTLQIPWKELVARGSSWD